MSKSNHPVFQMLERMEKAKAEGRSYSSYYHAGKGVKEWIGKQPKRKQRRCGALCRTAKPCKMRVVEGMRRCRLHGGLSTGPKTPEGRACIAEANRQRAAARAENCALRIERGDAIAEEISNSFKSAKKEKPKMNTTMKTLSPPTLDDAIALAKKAHDGQTDKAGAPYFGHIERVMNSVESDDLKIIALLHDSIEDTDDTMPINVTREYLKSAGYPEHIIAAIEGVTKRPDEEGDDENYMRFIHRAAQNPLSRAVKMADLRDNMDRKRITAPTNKDRRRIAKYQRALAVLEAI